MALLSRTCEKVLTGIFNVLVMAWYLGSVALPLALDMYLIH